MITSIQNYVDSVATSRTLVQPMVRLHSDDTQLENADEVGIPIFYAVYGLTLPRPQFLDAALSALRMALASGFSSTSDSYPQPFVGAVALRDGQAPYELPSVLVPPDVEFDTGSGDEAAGVVKKEEWPEYHLRLFDNDV